MTRRGGKFPMDELSIVNSLGNPSDYVDAVLNQDGQVELDWFCHGRSQPIAPYHTLFMDYAVLEEPDKGNAERYVDELFTRAEASLLIPYLCFSYGHPVGISVVPVPMDIFVAGGSMPILTFSRPNALPKAHLWSLGSCLAWVVEN